MDTSRTRIEDIQRNVDKAWEDLRAFAFRLAQAAASLDSGQVTLVSPTLRGAFIRAGEERARAAAEKAGIEDEAQKIREGRRNVALLTKEMSRLSKKEKELAPLIGAVAFAQADAAGADPEVAEALLAEVGRAKALEEEAARKGVAGALGRARRSIWAKSGDKNFSRCFSILEEKGLLDRLTGERAASLVASWRSVKASAEAIAAELELKKANVPDQGREEAGLAKVSAARERFAEAEAQWRECGINYGLYLFDNGSKWVCQDTPEEYLDLLQDMLNTRNYIDMAGKEIEKEKDFSAISDFQAMIEFNERKIATLRDEIRRVEEEIRAIEDDSEALRRKIRNVEARLS